jgi:hypothetical protein
MLALPLKHVHYLPRLVRHTYIDITVVGHAEPHLIFVPLFVSRLFFSQRTSQHGRRHAGPTSYAEYWRGDSH